MRLLSLPCCLRICMTVAILSFSCSAFFLRVPSGCWSNVVFLHFSFFICSRFGLFSYLFAIIFLIFLLFMPFSLLGIYWFDFQFTKWGCLFFLLFLIVFPSLSALLSLLWNLCENCNSIFITLMMKTLKTIQEILLIYSIPFLFFCVLQSLIDEDIFVKIWKVADKNLLSNFHFKEQNYAQEKNQNFQKKPYWEKHLSPKHWSWGKFSSLKIRILGYDSITWFL